MFSLELKVEMPDFDKYRLEVPCPLCKLHTWVTLGEIRRQEMTICRGCHVNIYLEDHLGQIQRFTQKFQKMISDIGRM